ncbi:hypothetical protein BN135_2356 [Cronobacter muytjensii 530]
MQPRFETAYRLAQRRLGDAQDAGGAGKAPLTRHGHKREQIIKISLHSGSCRCDL